MMKKVLFVSESLGQGGMERALVDMANALVKRNYDVTIILYCETNTLQSDLDERIHLFYVPRKPLKIRRRLPYFHRRYRYFKWEKRASARTLYRYYVGHKKYDVEIGFYRGPSIKIISGSPNKKSKKLAWVHTDLRLCDPKGITLFFDNIEEVKNAYAKFDNVVCVSKTAKESFDEVIDLPEKSMSIYNMISVEKIRKMSLEECELKKEKLTFATVGRLIKDKGYDMLLSATERLTNEGYDFDLWIVGGGRVEQELKEQAEAAGLNNVVFTGMQKNPYKYLKNADAFVCSSRREGFSIAVAEALAVGLPVISTRCTGPTEILDNGEYGILVDVNEDGVYKGMKAVLDNKEFLVKYKKKSIERCMFFDESNIMKQIVDLIEK